MESSVDKQEKYKEEEACHETSAEEPEGSGHEFIVAVH